MSNAYRWKGVGGESLGFVAYGHVNRHDGQPVHKEPAWKAYVRKDAPKDDTTKPRTFAQIAKEARALVEKHRNGKTLA